MILLLIVGGCLIVGLSLYLGSVSVAWAMDCTVTEVLANNVGSNSTAAKRTVTHDAYDESGVLTGATTPPATATANFLLTLSAGAATVDLRALTGTNGATVDGNGLKPQIVRVKNLGANPITITEGASNGHDAFPATTGLEIPAGGIVQLYFNDAASDIGATDKTWDVAGTGAQTSEWTIVLG